MQLARSELSKHLLLFAGVGSLVAIVMTCLTQIPSLSFLPPQSPPPQPVTPLAPHKGIENSSSPELRKLAEYEKTYGAITDQLMIFSDTPTTTVEATQWAQSMAEKLKEFSKYSVTPLVVFEPTGETAPLDFTGYRNGQYDTVLRTYFSALKTQGITDEMMGSWTFFAEANTPAWENSTEPGLIAACIKRTADIYKQTFPKAIAALLLDSKTYPSDDTEWEHGEKKSLLPYVKDLPHGLIDTFGLQGFPWAAPANESSERLFDPHTFLDARLATEAAAALGIKDIWFNSGTFSKSHTNDPHQTVAISARERTALFNGILEELDKAKVNDARISINIFSADKTQTTEATDWSYERSADDQQVLKNVVKNIQQKNISLSLYDSQYPN